MKNLGLDYESMKKRWNAEGSSGEVSGGSGDQADNMVVTPIVEKKHHLRQHLKHTVSHA
jgi:hypothetical protein